MSKQGTSSDASVIGAGAGGLVAAWQLARSGCDVLLLDAWKWAGGLLAGAELGGLRVDVGAEGYSVRGGGVEQLLADLDAAHLIATPNPLGAWLQTASGPHPIPKGLLYGLPSDPEAADVRAVVGTLPEPTANSSGSFADVVRAGYGSRVLDDLVAPLVGGVYSTDPYGVTLDELAPDLAARVASGTPLREAVTQRVRTAPPGGAVHGIRGGVNALVELVVTSARAASGAFELSCGEPVTGLERDGVRWRVTTTERTLTAPIVVLALPVDAAARLLGAASVPQTTRIEVISLVLDAPGLGGDEPRGTGVLVGADVPGVAAKALTHSTAKWAWLREAAEGRDYVRLSYGRRGQAPASAGLDESDLRRLVTADAAALLGRPVPEPIEVRRTGWAILPPGTPGVAATRDWLTQQRSVGLGLVGAGVAGVGLAAVVPQARAEVARLIEEQADESALTRENA